MNVIKNTTANGDVKVKLSILWIFVTLNYLYCDIVTVMDTNMLKQIMIGVMGPIKITQEFLLGSAIFMEIPISMILLSRMLKYNVNRWANLIAGIIMTAGQISSLFVGAPPTHYYIFFSIIEVFCTLFIVYNAWTWQNAEK